VNEGHRSGSGGTISDPYGFCDPRAGIWFDTLALAYFSGIIF
jgi:hypothetical protein